jgi:DNA-binding transcriptional LysR family regulator
MQVETLKVFCDVVRLRSFSRGAEANGVLQSAASQAVTQLEKRLGVALIDRSHRPWDLTAQGKTFYAGCRDVLDRYYKLEAEIRHEGNAQELVVRVAAIYSVGLGDLNQCVQSFMAEHPGLRVQIEYLHPDQVFDRVLADQVDFGIVSFPPTRRELAVVSWRREPMVLACPREHPLARFSAVPPRELAGLKFVAFDKGLGIRKEVDRFLKQHGAVVDIALEFDNVEAIKRAVEIGAGVSLLPAPTLTREVETGTLAAVALAGAEFARPLGIIHRRGKPLAATARLFLDRLQTQGPKGNTL